MTARETHEAQGVLASLERSLWAAIHEDAQAAIEKIEREIAELRPRVEAAQADLGGVIGRVPTENLERLEKKLAAMSRRAAKVGATAPVLTDTGEFDIEPIKEPSPIDPGEWDIVGERRWSFVAVSGKAPKLAGWSFVATLQHSEEGTIVRRVPGATREESEAMERKLDLSAFRTAPPVCDHCQTSRKRRDTYLVIHEDGTIKQVGRNCVEDFLGGQSPTGVLRSLEYLRDVEEMLREEPADNAGVIATIPIEDYLTHVALAIRLWGWTPRSRRDLGAPTADAALENREDLRHNRCHKDGTPLFETPTEADAADAKAALEHARGLEGTSDFEHNLKVAVATDNLDLRNVGIAAAAVMVHHRAIERDIERKAREEREADALNEHFGEIKDRVNLVLTVERVHAHPGNFGTTFITTLRDAEGRTFKWFGSYEIDRGAVVTGKWTIKDHDEWKGTKQTVLTRPARDLEIEVPSDDADGAEREEEVSESAQGPPCECELASHECSGPATHTIETRVEGGLGATRQTPICAEAARSYQAAHDSLDESVKHLFPAPQAMERTAA